MGKKIVPVVALLLGWLTPAGALAQAKAKPQAPTATVQESTAQDQEETPDVEDDWGDDVSGHLLPVPQHKPEQCKVEAAPFDYTFDDDGWGIRENKLQVVARGVAQPDVERPIRTKNPSDYPWPNKGLQRAFNFADAYSFPSLVPTISADVNSWAGGGGGAVNPTVFNNNALLDLYVLRLGINFFNVAPGSSWQERLDVDARIPIAISDRVQLSFFPGVGYNLDSKGNSTAVNVRFQGVIGYGGPGGFSAQLMAGGTSGPRPSGLLDPTILVDSSQALLGGLLAYRIADVVELRAEASSEFGKGPDRLSLLPGVAFYPWHDERLEIGTTAIVETRNNGVSFKGTTAAGGLLHLGFSVY